MSSKSTFVPTRSSQLHKKSRKEHENVVFVSHKPNKVALPTLGKSEEPIPSTSFSAAISNKPADIRKLRLEIRKLSTAGKRATHNETDHINCLSNRYLIGLGAKLPPKRNKNYKEMLTARRSAVENRKKRKAAGVIELKRQAKRMPSRSKKHLLVIGNKVRSAKQNSNTSQKKEAKAFLDRYGKAGKSQLQ